MRAARSIPTLGVTALLVLMAAGCGPKGLEPYDPNTNYRADTTSAGFTLTIDYFRRSFLPEPEAVREACRNAFVSIAQATASKRSRRIQPINEQQIEMRLQRNEVSNMTYCTATGPVAWAG
jgi:hypothetical protein